MRRIYKILFCIALAGFQGCSFLEVEKFGKSDIETFFSDVDGLRSGLAGSYRLLYNFYDGEFSEYPEVAADMLYLSNSEVLPISIIILPIRLRKPALWGISGEMDWR